MSAATPAVDPLLATKFFVPATFQTLVARPRLTALLNEGLQRRLTLVCAPAGFGKSTLLAAWVRALPPPPDGPVVAWVSLDEDDDNPARFADYVITALDRASPGVGAPALERLHAAAIPAVRAGLTVLINRLVESGAEYLLVLDDYHYVSDEGIHSGLAYLLEHLPPNAHIVISTRREPPLALLLARWRARGWAVEVRTDDLRSTPEEARCFLKSTARLTLSEEVTRALTQRTEGWLVGLQLLGLHLRGQADALRVLEGLSGTQEYILDYLTEEVLRGQPTEVQRFLLQTAILDELSASLCDAVLGYEPSAGLAGRRGPSQAMLEYLERANLFLVPLDAQRRWYRYHHLFAEALRYQLERRSEMAFPEPASGAHAATDGENGRVSLALLHQRAGIWYREHGYSAEAIEHALLAGDWNLALNWIALALAQGGILPWSTSPAERAQATDVRVAFAHLGILPPRVPTLLRWFARLPAAVLRARPAAGLTYALVLFAAGQGRQVRPWLDAAEAALSAEPSAPTAQPANGREQEIMRVWITVLQAFHAATLEEDGERALALADEAVARLTPQDHLELHLVAYTRSAAYLALGNVVAADRCAGQMSAQAQQMGLTFQQITGLANVGALLQAQGKLDQAEATFQQAIVLGSPENGPAFATAGIPYVYEADVLREWNRLDEALAAVLKGWELVGESWFPPLQLDAACVVLARLRLARGELDEARVALERADLTPETGDVPPAGRVMGTNEDRPQVAGRYLHPWCADAERVRLWLARGEIDQAAAWAEQVERRRQADLITHGRPYPAQYRRDCEDVARARIALACAQPDEALALLEPVAGRAGAGGRVSQVLEITLLQALAYNRRSQGSEDGDGERALARLGEAVVLGEREGFIRSFVDEGPRLAGMLAQLRARERRSRTPALDAAKLAYVDQLLAAFGASTPSPLSRPPMPLQGQRGSAGAPPRRLVEPLCERELEVLRRLAQGASNAEIAEQLVLALNTVKRHISNIFGKLGAANRTQAVAEARALGLLDP